MVPLESPLVYHSAAVDGSCYTERPSGKMAMLDAGVVLEVTTRTGGEEKDGKTGRQMR